MPARGSNSSLSIQSARFRGLLELTPWPDLQAWHTPATQSRAIPIADVRISLRLAENAARDALAKTIQLPLFDKPDSTSHARTARAACDFFDAIPSCARRSAYRYPSRHQSLMALATAHPLAWQLLDPHCGGNPTLAFGLAVELSRTVEAGERRRIIEMTAMPRRRIARRLGFSGSRACLEVLAKVPPRHMTTRVLRELRTALETQRKVQLLRSLSTINPTITSLVVREDLIDILTTSFLNDAGTVLLRNRVEFVRYVANYAQNIAPRFVPRDRPLQSIRDLNACVRDWGGADLPSEIPCPLTLDIPEVRVTPLTSVALIHEEAATMQHCLSSFVRRLAVVRDCFAYRVTAPERGTLLIERRRDHWRIAQARGPRNCRLNARTIDLLSAALYIAQHGFAPPVFRR